ncbi:MutS family DNA mismatch repair protein [Dyadobacter sp. CY356]|uniref:MutS family DNA mismatch repair protein n=1 Tax=Dyadobacter sp. CY356 TaxID=2906442 RepID=UPI001F276150|nr:MutS family DNA mismatch repair protein [Dyadobacter sp. CY356]MCF0056621.1 DNA mismatch repair protein MutS [Dyadobacter sp. CY356]
MDNQKEITNPHTFFEAEFQKAKSAEAVAAERFNLLSIGRIAAFLSIFGTAWLWNHFNQPGWGIGTAIAFVLFLILMRLQQTAKTKRNFQRNIQTINEDEIQRLSFKFLRKDTGIHFQEKNHSFATDLDIFGEYSLYRLLNRTRTSEGSRRLANWLKHHASLEEILMRQEAVEEFKNNPELRQTWEATALLHEHAAQQVGAFRDWSAETLPDSLQSSLRWRFFPLVTLLIGGLFFAGFIPGWLLILSLAWHLVILRRYQETLQNIVNRTTALGFTLSAYADLLDIADAAPFRSRWWKQRQTLIRGSAHSLRKAGMLFERLDYRNHPFFAIFVGITTMWDLHCLAGLESWKKNNKEHLHDWLDVLADTEAMNSLAGNAFAYPDSTVPQVTWEKGVYIETSQMGHPLIPKEKRVSNNFGMNGLGQTILVTGSNMSGKSTFLRTIGLNLVLAQMGAVVSASKFACSPLRVFSSMRTQDSLEESTSSFYAELKRLRQLLELADEKNESPVFYLLDEILKGTNSADRHKGAEALIRQLHAKSSAGLVSTHDLELGEWGATETYVRNFHFRSDVENGQLKFDYQLHDGICKSFNASELMRMMGIDIDMQKS